MASKDSTALGAAAALVPSGCAPRRDSQGPAIHALAFARSAILLPPAPSAPSFYLTGPAGPGDLITGQNGSGSNLEAQGGTEAEGLQREDGDGWRWVG